MTAGIGVETLDTLVRFTMSKEVAEAVVARFADLSARGESISYLDCVLHDAALDILGLEQKYYGIPDEEWRDISDQRKALGNAYAAVKTIDVTDTWREVQAKAAE